MSVRVSMRSLSQHTQGSAYFPTNQGQSSLRSSGQQRQSVVPLNFPATKEVLWDRTPMGDSTILHITKYRNVGLHILEKSVQLAHRHALQSACLPYRCFLIGSVTIDKDEEGVTITIDRFDPGRDIPGRSGRMPTARLPGDLVIPLMISINEEAAATTHSKEDFIAAFKVIEQSFSSSDSLDLGSTLSFRIHCCCYDSADHVTFNLHIGAVTMGTVFKATPINPIPIIPTALARNLLGPLNLSEVQGIPKAGYVTMDQTRKLLLLLESDPKACTLPLVGIWLSGLSNMCSPFVWVSCLRYMFNNGIHERVFTADQGFLLVMFSPTSRQPSFYECHSLSGDQPSFELIGCRENIHLYKHGDQTARTPVQLELTTARDGPNRAEFLQAAKQFTSNRQPTWSKPHPKPAPPPRPHQAVVAVDEDVQSMPRPSPKPLIDKSPTVKPSVPELSLIFDSFLEGPQETDSTPQTQDSEPNPTPTAGIVPHQEIPAGYKQCQYQQLTSAQNAQENKPFNQGQTGNAKFDRQMRKIGHEQTPPGRPGPLKPVNTNVAHVAEKSRRPNPHSQDGKQNFAYQQAAQKGGVISTNDSTKQSSLGTKSKKPPSPASSGRGQQLVGNSVHTRARPTNQALVNDSTPRQKPPRPMTRKSEILQKTLPPMNDSQQNNTFKGKGSVPPRRMSYPVPASSQEQKAVTGNSQQHQVSCGHHKQVTTPTVSHVPRMSHNQHPAQQSPGMPSHPKNQSGQAGAHQSVAPCQVNQSDHASGSTGSPGIPNTPQASMSTSSHLASALHGQNASPIPQSQSISPPNAQNHSGVGASLAKTGSPQPHLGISSAVKNGSPVVGQNVTTTQNTGGNVANQVQSLPADLSRAKPLRSAATIPQERINYTPHQSHGVESTSPYHMQQRTGMMADQSQSVPPSESTQLQPQLMMHHGQQGQQQDLSRGGRIDDSNDAMVQLRRQEQLIQQLQAQIQILLQAQAAQATPPIPSGLITPPATPTSPGISNQHVVTPTSQPLHNHCHNQATAATHPVSTDTVSDTPPLKTMCSMAVMTGKSLFWPDGTSSPIQNTKKQTSVGTSMTPQASPSKDTSQPQTSTSSQNATFDTEATPDSDPDITLPLQETRDETQSTVFDVSAVTLQSFTEEDSPRKMSPHQAGSPEWRPGRNSSRPHSTHPETTQGTYHMDSLHSPVLGESASTCAPPQRRGHNQNHSDSEDDSEDGSSDGSRVDDAQEDSETEDEDETVDQPVSLLYRDERKFYQNLLGRVEQMLTAQTLRTDEGHHGDAMTAQEELRQLGLLSPGNHCETTMDRSIMYRSMCMLNPEFFPRINYVSLMDVHLDSPNLSYEANAIAMKYLTEEELTQLSAGFKGQASTPVKVNPLLRTALTGLGDAGLSAGLSAVDLSMASRKYMEKHGLLETPGKRPGGALGFDTAEETAAQKIAASKLMGKEKSGPKGPKHHQRKTSKQKSKRSLEAQVTAAPRSSEKTKLLLGIHEPQGTSHRTQSPGQQVNAEGVDSKLVKGRLAEKVSPEKTPCCSPGVQPLPAPLGVNNENKPQKDPKTGDAKVREQLTPDSDKKAGGNILDIERLKQLPKLF